MPESDIDESVVRADRLSKILALFLAVGTFFAASYLTDDALFSMIVAAFAGIGARIYIPYHASITVPDPDHMPIQAYEGTGNYHQGAVGAAVVLASFFALVMMLFEPVSSTALVAGGGAGVISFLLLRRRLPS